jgi:hypothetical protein
MTRKPKKPTDDQLGQEMREAMTSLRGNQPVPQGPTMDDLLQATSPEAVVAKAKPKKARKPKGKSEALLASGPAQSDPAPEPIIYIRL